MLGPLLFSIFSRVVKPDKHIDSICGTQSADINYSQPSHCCRLYSVSTRLSAFYRTGRIGMTHQPSFISAIRFAFDYRYVDNIHQVGVECAPARLLLLARLSRFSSKCAHMCKCRVCMCVWRTHAHKHTHTKVYEGRKQAPLSDRILLGSRFALAFGTVTTDEMAKLLYR